MQVRCGCGTGENVDPVGGEDLSLSFRKGEAEKERWLFL
jgi:hypothetical protein